MSLLNVIDDCASYGHGICLQIVEIGVMLSSAMNRNSTYPMLMADYEFTGGDMNVSLQTVLFSMTDLAEVALWCGEQSIIISSHPWLF
jgi:hypothetical protein